MEIRNQVTGMIFSLMIASAAMADDAPNNTRGGGLFIEPAITSETGTLRLSYPAPFSGSNSDETVRGLGLGARVGVHFHDVLFGAVDLRYSKPRYESSVLGDSADAVAYNAGLTIGLQTPIAGLRIWGTYIADGVLDPASIRGFDLKYSGFNGYRIGGGFYIAVVSINLEYQEAKYKSNAIESYGPFTPGTLDSVYGTQKSYVVSVSFPIAM